MSRRRRIIQAVNVASLNSVLLARFPCRKIPESICSIAYGHSAARECATMIQTFRKHDKATPVFVLADRSAKFILSTLVNEPGVRIELDAPVEFTGSFHNREVIARKMDCMKKAILQFKGTLFVDADMVFFGPVTLPEKDLVLTPNWNPVIAIETGQFNAGFVYSTVPTFPDQWKSAFRNEKQGFFEQTSLTPLATHYGAAVAPAYYGVHFSERKYWDTGRVIHCHTDQEILSRLDGKYAHLMNEHAKQVKKRLFDTYNFVK